ncbi:MAG: PIG-L family deacetylase [Terriglobales bacterium]
MPPRRRPRPSIPLLSLALCAGLLCSALAAGAQTLAPAIPPPDPRFKADILVFVAHPDDEGEISGYLARAVFDQHKRVAVAYGTWGNSGGNLVGTEQAAALADVREIEARQALAFLDIHHVWYLGGTDTPGNNVLHSLETWNHGSALEKAVRLIRLTRPSVILAWLPDFDVGENHEDHQAAGVIATEAFDLAGNPTAFPAQVTPPRNRLGFANLTEGLRPWQPEKLYYFTDAYFHGWMRGKGPVYSVTAVSPSKHVPYYQLVAREAAFHATQQGVGDVAARALRTGNYAAVEFPDRFILAKSLVTGPGTPATAPIFTGVVPGPIPYAPPPGYRQATDPTLQLALQLGSPWHFYRQFWPAHGLGPLGRLYTPEDSVQSGHRLTVPLLLRNNSNRPERMTIQAALPPGWRQLTPPRIYLVGPGHFYPVRVTVVAPAGQKAGWTRIAWTAQMASGGNPGPAVGHAALRVYVLR